MLSLIFISLISTTVAIKDFNGFNGTGKVLLESGKPLVIEILDKRDFSVKKPTVQASFELFPNVTTSTGTSIVNGTDGTSFNLVIKNIQPIKGINNSDASLTSSEVTFEIYYHKNIGYWILTNLKVALTGTLKGSTSFNIDENLDVFSKPGYTKSLADLSCQRGYATCAPKSICWACSDQTIKPLKDSVQGNYFSQLKLSGIKLQPMLGNDTRAPHSQFGYEWDCDPIIPLSVWVGILLAIVLIMFISWAVDMLVNLHTPNRFDDPRGKPLTVPTTD